MNGKKDRDPASRTNGGRFCAAGVVFLALTGTPSGAHAARQTVHGSDLARFSRAPLAGAVPLDETMTVAIGLPWRDPEALEALITDQYDPRGAGYRHFLSPDEFSARFSPTQENYQKVLDFARAKHLSVTATQSNRLIVDVRADAGTIQKAFGVTLRRFRRPDGSEFRAPDREPSLELDVPLAQISGLDDFDRPRNHLVHYPRSMKPQYGTGQDATYQGYDFRDAYLNGVPASLAGSGQTIGLVEFSAFYPGDISAYEQSATPALPANAPVVVAIDGGGSTSDPNYVGEASLDIEMALSMAPSATIVAYVGPSTGNTDVTFNDILSNMATKLPVCRQISCSWNQLGDATSTELFEELTAQGQGFFQASGDDGAYGSGNAASNGDVISNVPPPMSLSPYLTVVGGTQLATTAPSGSPPTIAYASESTWNVSGADGGASGGGICLNLLALPGYQAGVPMSTNGGSTAWRDIPDVAMVADDVLLVSNNGAIDKVSGTSIAAPLWAAFTALVNEQAAAQGMGPLGFANPALYAVGGSPAYAGAFHDIADGSNNDLNGDNPTHFSAVPGYDLSTGWGSPKGMALITALVGQVAVLGTSGLGIETEKVPFVTFPNPFSRRRDGVLSLRFAAMANAASLDVYDTAYRCLTTVSIDPAQAGLGEGQYCGCDGSGYSLAPGTYYAVLRGGGRPQTCKFTVLP